MAKDDLKPYEFARRRFIHAFLVLRDASRSVHERLLDAIVALTPLRTEDLPRSCHLLYERVQQLIGPDLWSDVATAGSLAPAVRALSERQAADAVQWIYTAGDALHEHYKTASNVEIVQPTESAAAIRQDVDDGARMQRPRGFYLT